MVSRTTFYLFIYLFCCARLNVHCARFPANETLEVLRVIFTAADLIKAQILQIIEISVAWEG